MARSKLLALTTYAAKSQDINYICRRFFFNTQNQFHKGEQTAIQHQEQINEQMRLLGPYTRTTKTATH